MVIGRVGGAILVLGSVAFVAVFTYLASTFGYPDVLDRPAGEVLPALAAGGSSLRAAWLTYGAIPLTLLIGGLASMPLLERGGGRMLARFGGAAAAIAAVAMMVGLLRWPSIQWALAQNWSTATIEQRAVYATIFDGANAYLGNVFGEYIGEMMLAGWFITIGIAARRLERAWVGVGSIAMGLIVMASAQRQLTGLVDPVSDLNNLLLPLWLIVVGVTLMKRPGTLSASVPSIA
jgi:hypothetical protein